MVCLPIGHVYVQGFVHLFHDGSVLLGHISQFFQKEGVPGVFTTIVQLRSAERDSYFIGDEIIIPVTDILCVVQAPCKILRRNSDSTLIPLSCTEYSNFVALHPLKSIAGHKPVAVLPLVLYSDDTSANKSKRWNKFDSWCLKLAGLPNEENQKLNNIVHISSSNKVELAGPMVEELVMLEKKGITVFDAHEKKEVLVMAPVLCIICDNSRASEITNNLGPGSRMFCRICMADRDQSLDAIGDMRLKQRTLEQMALISSQSTGREKSNLKTQFGVKDHPNPLLHLPLDLHRWLYFTMSTPVETLHTILLGPYKYLPTSLMQRLSNAEKGEIEARLCSLDYSGMDYRLSYSIVRHFKSFVGRDYKSLAQLALYVLSPYMRPHEKVVWLALSKVFRITYCQQFKLSDYDDNKQICESFVRTIHQYCPELKKKLKIHLLLHLPDNMLDFGPTSAYNTERCESFNGLIRSKNIFANRLSPSRDIAQGFAVLEHLRYICSGGTIDGVSCGKGLTSLFNSPAVQAFLNGFAPSHLQRHKTMYQPGSLRKVASANQGLHALKVAVKGEHPVTIRQLMDDPQKIILLSSVPVDTVITSASAVVGQVGPSHLINVGDSVNFSASPGEVDMGILAACFAERNGSKYCIVQLYEPLDSFGTQVLNEYECPLYFLTSTFRCVPSSCIHFAVSFFHECSSSCIFSHINSDCQIEREIVATCKLTYKHDYQSSVYFLNIYRMHQ